MMRRMAIMTTWLTKFSIHHRTMMMGKWATYWWSNIVRPHWILLKPRRSKLTPNHIGRRWLHNGKTFHAVVPMTIVKNDFLASTICVCTCTTIIRIIMAKNKCQPTNCINVTSAQKHSICSRNWFTIRSQNMSPTWVCGEYTLLRSTFVVGQSISISLWFAAVSCAKKSLPTITCWTIICSDIRRRRNAFRAPSAPKRSHRHLQWNVISRGCIRNNSNWLVKIAEKCKDLDIRRVTATRV